MHRSFFIPFLLLFVVAGCSITEKRTDTPLVMVSIVPQKYFVERIADTLVRVEVMVPVGSSPETYEPTASQLRFFSDASVYFALGLLDFEKAILKRIQKQNEDVHVVNHSKNLSLLDGVCHGHDHGHSHAHGYDPHVWSSPVEVRKMIETIKVELSALMPEYTDVFALNASLFLSDIDSLDRFISESLEITKTRKFFLFHPALTYFARDYNLTQVALEEDGKAPSMKHFKSVLQTAKEQGATTIFIQKEFDANTAKTAAADMGGQVKVIDPLDGNWLENMYDITNMLKDALNGN
jgi:zinc transport system substrate-binding protein